MLSIRNRIDSVVGFINEAETVLQAKDTLFYQHKVTTGTKPESMV